jgi:hypothetical protein
MTVPLPDPNTEDCRALRSILARVGDKWTVLIVVLLGDGPKRFNENQADGRRYFTEEAHLHAAWIRTRPPGKADCLPDHSAARGLRIDRARRHLVAGRGTAQFVGACSCGRDSHIARTVRREGRSLTPVWPSIAAIRPAHATLLIPGFVQRRSTIGAAAADVPETEAASGGSEGRRWVLLLDPPKSSPMTGIGATPPLAHQT